MPLEDEEVFELAFQYERAKTEAAEAEKVKKEAQKAITDELIDRGTRAIEGAGVTGFTRVTVVQRETLSYDDDAMWSAATPREKRAIFDELLNLNDLPFEVRKKVVAVLKEHKDERKAATTRRLNTQKLSTAVQEEVVSADWVAEFARINQSAPYIVVSHGDGE